MLVTARRLTELKVADDELAAPAPVERSPRRVSAPELVASADDALIALDGDREHTRPPARGRRLTSPSPRAAPGSGGVRSPRAVHGRSTDPVTVIR